MVRIPIVNTTATIMMMVRTDGPRRWDVAEQQQSMEDSPISAGGCRGRRREREQEQEQEQERLEPHLPWRARR